MPVTIAIPPQMRLFSGERETLKIDMSNLHEHDRSLRALIDLLEAEAPGIKNRLLDQNGRLSNRVNLYIGKEYAHRMAEKAVKKLMQDVLGVDYKYEDLHTDPLEVIRLKGDEEIAILTSAQKG